jgi:hypothetical protein
MIKEFRFKMYENPMKIKLMPSQRGVVYVKYSYYMTKLKSDHCPLVIRNLYCMVLTECMSYIIRKDI